ncbi:hypothetical protein MNBD_GAMMA06-212 [hydrothermal vent metagenome]|uniref:HTH cro/C1-type domain-containing protein n=1 Tax=hydrothermal vent metagenome TaxID=652676 RepID=A0A3B0WR78_9ZZZZ
MNTNANAPIEILLQAISKHLNTRTKQARLKKKDLAALAEVNQNTITAIMAGGDMKVSTLIRLTRVLDDTQWLQPLLTVPKTTPLDQLQKTPKKSTANSNRKKPVARQMGRKHNEG